MAGKNQALFLKAITPEADEPLTAVTTKPRPVAVRPKAGDAPPPVSAPILKAKPPTRVGLKHIGAYLDKETVEKVAVLRARLELDNSELIKLAVEELYRKQTAKRAFGDA